MPTTSTDRPWYRRLPSWARAALNTAWQTFAAATVPALLRFLADLESWAAGAGRAPSAGVLGHLAAAALVAALAAAITAVFRAVRPAEAAYGPARGNPPL